MSTLVHGIVSLDPPTVRCDGCGYQYSHPKLGLAVLLSGITFNPFRTSSERLCASCRAARTKAGERGWAAR